MLGPAFGVITARLHWGHHGPPTLGSLWPTYLLHVQERDFPPSISSITNSMNLNLGKLQEIVEERGAWHAAVHATKSQTQLSD